MAKTKLKRKTSVKKRVRIDEPEILEYFTYLHSPARAFLMNFIVGVARGFGFVMGATVVVALVLYFVGQVLVDIPIVGNFFEWLNNFLQESLNGSSISGTKEFGPQ